jgi:hypothetical protein
MRLLYLFTVFCVVNLWMLSTTDSKTSTNHETASGAVPAGHHKQRAERAAILLSESSSRLIVPGVFAKKKKKKGVDKTTTSCIIYVRPPVLQPKSLSAWHNSTPTGYICVKTHTEVSLKSLQTIKFWLKSNEKSRHYTYSLASSVASFMTVTLV